MSICCGIYMIYMYSIHKYDGIHIVAYIDDIDTTAYIDYSNLSSIGGHTLRSYNNPSSNPPCLLDCAVCLKHGHLILPSQSCKAVIIPILHKKLGLCWGTKHS